VTAIRQSDEPADISTGLKEEKPKFLKILSVLNLMGSSMTRESDRAIYIHGGQK